MPNVNYVFLVYSTAIIPAVLLCLSAHTLVASRAIGVPASTQLDTIFGGLGFVIHATQFIRQRTNWCGVLDGPTHAAHNRVATYVTPLAGRLT